MKRIASAAVIALAAAAFVGGATSASPRIGGTLEAASFGDCLNTWFVCGGGATEITNAVILGAYQVSPDLTYHPMLVSGATLRDHPFSVTYHIRPRATWSDGVPVTAADFVFTYRAFSNPRFADTFDDQPLYAPIRQVLALGPKTVRVVFAERDAAWRDLFHSVLPAHALTGEDLTQVWLAGIDNPKTGAPIGDGAFLVGSYTPNEEVTLVRNKRYWGAHKAYLDNIVFTPILDPVDEIDALAAGRVDAVNPQAEPQLADLPRSRFSVVTGGGTTFEQLEFRLGSGGNPLLRNLWVRQAIAYGIDRTALVRSLFATLAPSIRPLQNLIYVPSARSYRAHWQIYRHDTSRAQHLLASHGCRRGGDGIFVCGGTRLALRFATTANNPLRASTFSILHEQLARIGIELDAVFAAPPVFFGPILQGGDFDLALFTWVNDPDPGYAVDIWRCGGVRNYAGYCDRNVSRQLLESNRVLNDAKRSALMNRIDSELAAALPALPLYQRPVVVAYDKRVHGIVDNATNQSWTWNAADWWVSP